MAAHTAPGVLTLARVLCVYMPCSDRIPLLSALYLPADGGTPPERLHEVAAQVAQMVNELAPGGGQLTGELPDPAAGDTILMLCHSAQTAAEAVSLAETRPVIVWGWLLSESIVEEIQQRLPVVFGDQSSPAAAARLEALTPSEPDPARDLTGICRTVDHDWGVPPLDDDDR